MHQQIISIFFASQFEVCKQKIHWVEISTPALKQIENLIPLMKALNMFHLTWSLLLNMAQEEWENIDFGEENYGNFEAQNYFFLTQSYCVITSIDTSRSGKIRAWESFVSNLWNECFCSRIFKDTEFDFLPPIEGKKILVNQLLIEKKRKFSKFQVQYCRIF